jgi:hypothetical protein
MRNFINLIENALNAGDSMILYRGDSTKIDKFQTEMTSTFGLFGHGIYLTNDKRVAKDYMTKGSGNANDVIFKMGNAKTKQEVLDRFLYSKAKMWDINTNDVTKDWYISSVPFADGGEWGNLTNPERRAEKDKRIQMVKQKWDTVWSKEYEIRIKLDRTGVIQKKALLSTNLSKFEVPLSYINKTIKADDKINDNVLDDILYTLRKHGDGNTARDIEFFIKNSDDDYITFRTIFTSITGDSPLKDDRDVQLFLIQSLQESGYVGIEYVGGITLGGGAKHRAFVFWDSNEVNKFRIE